MIKLLHMLSPKSFAIVVWGMALVIPALCGLALLDLYGMFIGIIIGAVAIGCTIQYFLQLVPKKTALLVMNPLLFKSNGEAKIRTALSGWNIFYPWEQAREDGYFSLERIRIPVSETFPAKDGVIVKVTGSITISPDPKKLLNYLVSQSIVRDKILDRVRNFISQIIAKKDAKTIRDNIKNIDRRVTNYFSTGINNSKEEKDGTQITSEIEKKHGIVFENATVDVDFDDAYQQALTTKAKAKVLQETVAGIQKDSSGEDVMPAVDAWDNAQVIAGNVKKTVNTQKVEGKDAAHAIMSLGMAMANAIGGNKGTQDKSSRKGGGK